MKENYFSNANESWQQVQGKEKETFFMSCNMELTDTRCRTSNGLLVKGVETGKTVIFNI